MKRDHELIYTIHKGAPHFLVFMPGKEATDLARVRVALNAAET